VPPCEIKHVYDLDGNILTNGVWSFRWDAENRMVAAYSNDTLLVVNVYDDQSRRIRKVTDQGTRSFVYDGWNPVRELITDNGSLTTKYYCWGTDLSGTLQGAGGVGGLQAVIVDGETPATYYPCYDANGNITAYVDELGDVRASYAFDAFGQTISQSGDMASDFSHRFSTKYADDETGLYYYGYRYYSPGSGRWVSRDPIGEEGGLGLYLFLRNDAINSFDLFGNCGSQSFWWHLFNDEEEVNVKMNLKKHQKKLNEILPALLALCKNQKCICGSEAKNKCEDEAKKIAARIATIFRDNYGDGPYSARGDDSGDPVGGYKCWDWSRNFYQELMALKPMQFTFFHAMNRHSKGAYVHYFVHMYIGNRRDPAGKRDPECALTLDDNYKGTNGFIHEGLIPPTSSGASWGSYQIAPFHQDALLMKNL